MVGECSEIVLIINDADRAEGFFRFSCTKRSDWERLIRKVGKGSIIKEYHSTLKGEVTQYNALVGIEHWNSRGLGVRSHKRKLSPKALEIARRNLARMRAGKR